MKQKGVSLSTRILFAVVVFVIIAVVVFFLATYSKSATFSFINILKTAFGG